MTAPLLEARNITKRFGGIAALRNVSFDVRPGEIHALCGENGAGKSTLIRVLSGYFPWRSFEGELFWLGEPLRLDSVRCGERAGMAVIHQELSLVDELSVAENLFLGRLPSWGGWWDWPATLAQTREMLRRFDVQVDPEARVAELGIALRQIVEIARAVARRPRLLILDEPTAALGETEVDRLLRLLRLLREEGVACIYISHKLEEVRAIADRITVLRDGQTIHSAPVRQWSTAEIIRQMVGRELSDLYPTRTPTAGPETALRVIDLSARSATERSVQLNHVSLEVQSGEILGMGGLMGAGRSELLMHLYGLWGKRTRGEVWLRGAPYSRPTPRESLRRGLMLVTEDRKRHGLIPGQTTHHNVSLSSLKSVARWGWIDWASEHRHTSAVLDRTQFRALSDQVPVERLSGGNQQKVVIARGLLCRPQVVLFDEPTRGVDVAARREIYDEAERLAGQGIAVIWVSSDLPELMGVCDRIAMMRDGMIAGTFTREEGFDSSRLMECALGQSNLTP